MDGTETELEKNRKRVEREYGSRLYGVIESSALNTRDTLVKDLRTVGMTIPDEAGEVIGYALTSLMISTLAGVIEIVGEEKLSPEFRKREE